MSSLEASEKHVTAPTVLTCPVCAEESGVAPPDRLANDREAPARSLDHGPCEQCVKYMEQGIVLVSVRDGESGQNPYRTGRLCVVTKDFVEREIENEVVRREVLQRRVAFVGDKAWASMGLPMKEH